MTHYIWIHTPGSVIGFLPEEIAEFEEHFKAAKLSQDEYWPMFAWYFQPQLGYTFDPHGFSALHHDPIAWAKLKKLRRHQ